MAFKGVRETLEQKEAFDYYYSLGSDRRLAAVVQKFKKARSTIHAWSKAFNWQKRAEQRDIEIGKKLEEKTNNTIVNEKAKYREEIKNYMGIVRSVLFASKDRLKNGEIQIAEVTDINSLMLAYERLFKLDMLLMGEATEVNEHLFNLDIESAREKLKKVLKNKLKDETEDDE